MIRNLFLILAIFATFSCVKKETPNLESSSVAVKEASPFGKVGFADYINSEVARIRYKESETSNKDLISFIKKVKDVKSIKTPSGVLKLISQSNKLISQKGKLEPVLYLIRPTLYLYLKTISKKSEHAKLLKKSNLIIEKDLSKFIQIHPEYYFSYKYRSGAYLIQEKYSLALKDLNKSLELNPNDSKTYYKRFRLNLKMNNFDEAIADYHKSFLISGKISYELNSPENYNKFSLKLLSLPNGLTLVRKLLKINIEKYPNYHTTYSFLASLQLLKKDYSSALINVNKSIELEPKQRISYSIKATLFFKQKNYSSAIENSKKALRYSKNKKQKSDSYLTIARSYIYMKKYVLAKKYLDKSIRLNSKNYSAFYYRGDLFSKIGKYEIALSDYNKALLLKPKYHAAVNAKAMLYFKKKEYRKSLAHSNKAISMSPKNFVYYMQRGLTHLSINNDKKGLKDLKMLKKLCKPCLDKKMIKGIERKYNVVFK